jgi:hypothetical protein
MIPTILLFVTTFILIAAALIGLGKAIRAHLPVPRQEHRELPGNRKASRGACECCSVVKTIL